MAQASAISDLLAVSGPVRAGISAHTRNEPFVVVVWHVKVVGYIRVSTEDQADSGAGLEAQRAAIHEQCRRRSWELLAIHSDTASARSLAARPGLTTAEHLNGV